MNKKYQHTWLVILADTQRLTVNADCANIEANGSLVFYEKVFTNTRLDTWQDHSLLQAFPPSMWLSATRMPKEEKVDASNIIEHNSES